MKPDFPTEQFDATRTKIHFPEIIVTVQNSRVSDICQARAGLSKVFTVHKLADALANLADGWFEPHQADDVEVAPTAPDAWPDVKLLRSAVRTLNEQHRRTSAGFYGLGSRFFKARSVAGVLQIFDWDNWTPVSQERAKFHDHNGRDISFT